MIVKVKILIEEERRGGLDGDCDKVNCLSKLCAGCKKYLKKWIKRMEEDS